MDAPCVLIADDTVLDKRHAKKIETVHYQYSGNEHDVINGIGLVNMVWYSREKEAYLPVDFRIYDVFMTRIVMVKPKIRIFRI